MGAAEAPTGTGPSQSLLQRVDTSREAPTESCGNCTAGQVVKTACVTATGTSVGSPIVCEPCDVTDAADPNFCAAGTFRPYCPAPTQTSALPTCVACPGAKIVNCAAVT